MKRRTFWASTVQSLGAGQEPDGVDTLALRRVSDSPMPLNVARQVEKNVLEVRRVDGRVPDVIGVHQRHEKGMRWLLSGVLILAVISGLPAIADEVRSAAAPSIPGKERMVDRSLKDAFDPKELRALAEERGGDDRRLMRLILRAGIERDAGFQDLLTTPALRSAPNVDLALSAYDYMLNQSEVALDHILAQLATEEMGADADAVVVLSILNEWDRTIRAVRKHFFRTDGAGGLCHAGFEATRAFLYPEKYAEMREVIEAPITWPGPLLPIKSKR